MGLAVQPNPNSGNKSSPAPEWLLLLSAFYFFLFAFVLYISCTFQFEIQFFIHNNNSNLGPESLMPGPPHFAKNNTIISLQLQIIFHLKVIAFKWWNIFISPPRWFLLPSPLYCLYPMDPKTSDGGEASLIPDAFYEKEKERSVNLKK